MNRIFITGDTHGDLDIGKIKAGFNEKDNLTKQDYLIIAGDFGGVWYGSSATPIDSVYIISDELKKHFKEDNYLLKWYEDQNYTTLFIDGNHENHALLDSYPVEEWHGGKIHRIMPSVIHLMRGQIYEIAGKTFFTMGGASSTDKEWRVENVSWWERELPNEKEYEEARNNLKKYNNRVDYIITHCIGREYMQKIGRTRVNDRLTEFLSEIDKTVEYKHWYFGHYHKDMEIDDRHTLLYQEILEL